MGIQSHSFELSELADGYPDGLIVVSPSGSVAYANVRASELLGVAPEGLVGSRWQDLPVRLPLTPRRVEAGRPLRVRDDAPPSQDFALNIDGRPVFVEVRVRAARNADGAPRHFLAVVTDVTAARGREQTLRDTQALFSRVVESVADGILMVDRQYRVTYANAAAENLFGRPRRQLTHLCWYELDWDAPERNGEPVGTEDIHRRVFEEGQGVAGQERFIRPGPGRPDGATVMTATSFMPTRDAFGRVEGMIVSCTDISERARVEEKLLRGEERFRALVEHSSDGVVLLDGGGRVVYASGSTVHLLGYTADDLRELDPLSLVHPEDRADALSAAAAVAAAPDVPVTRDLRCRHADGRWRALEVTACNRLGLESVRAVVVNYRDQTEKWAAEDGLRQSEQRYRRLFERNLAGVFRSTLEGRVADCNDAFARTYGYPSADAMRGREVLEFYPDPNTRQVLLNRLFAGGAVANHESRMRRRDGSDVWVLENVALLTEGGQTLLEGTALDITERKRAEQTLARQHALLTGLLDSVPDLIFYKDRDGRYLGCNDAFAEYAGVAEESLCARTDGDVFPDGRAGLWAGEEADVLADGTPRRLEGWLHYPDGRRALVEVLLTPLVDDNGTLLGLIGIGRDLTDRKRLEDQLRQSGKMEAIGQLAGGIAHDFRNLLTVILGNAAMATEAGGLPDTAVTQLAAMREAAEQASDLTTNLLGYARKTALSLEPADLKEVLGRAIELVRRAIDPRIDIRLEAEPGLWPGSADESHFIQVVLNLCLNARDAMPDGGTLTLSAANVALAEGDAGANINAKAGHFVRVRVEDTGYGMTPEVRGRVFEPFFTTKPVGQGTGLGLSMVHGIVGLHNGWVECASEPGRGTRFDLFIPRAEAEVQAPPPPPARPAGGRETVLLADDEPMVRKLGEAILKKYGYRVLLAEDGQVAVDLYRDRGGEIDLVVLDLTMPRLSGTDALPLIREIDPAAKVVFASGYSEEYLNMADKAGVLGFISKPYRPEDLAGAVRGALDRAAEAVTA